MNESSANPRRCAECGTRQHRVFRNGVPYPESGLNNVELFNVPVWVCTKGHEEIEIPAITQLHELLAHMILRKPAGLVGAEIKFLRRRVEMTAKDFAAKIGMTPVRLSQLENLQTPLPKRADLLMRFVMAVLLSARDNTPLPTDLARLLEQFEEPSEIGTHRLKHNARAVSSHRWEEAA